MPQVNLSVTSQVTRSISDALYSKIVEKLKSMEDPQIYWDYRGGIDNKTILKALEYAEKYKDAYPIDYIYERVFDWNHDYICDLEIDHLKEALSWFETELQEELGVEEIDLEEIARELKDDLLDYVSVDYDLKDLLKGDVNIRFEMLSNYDCINSAWFEQQSGYSYPDSYFADTIKMLGLSPAKVKKTLNDHGVETHGKWPSRKDDKRLIDYDDFWVEEENRSWCPASLLTIVATVNQYDLLTNGLKGKILIPKGNYVGFYSSWQGGGSMIEAPLLRDYVIDLDKKYDKSGYLQWRMELDVRGNGYTIDEVYGVVQSFWGNEIEFINKTNKNQ